MQIDQESNLPDVEPQRQPISLISLLLTCAAGLAVIVALAWIEVEIHTFAADEAQTETETQVR